MITLTVQATLQSQVHLGANNTGSNFLRGLCYIPGRTFLGAAAWAWLGAGGSASAPEFVHRYVSGAASWGDLYPLPQDPDTGCVIPGTPSVVPRTTKVCKLFELRHGWVDSLLSFGAAQEERCPFTAAATSSVCSMGLRRLDGVFVRKDAGDLQVPAVQRQHRVHGAIGFRTGTAKPGALYSREVLGERQVFRGHIQCLDEATATDIAASLKETSLTIGGGRSRGYGQVDIHVERENRVTLSADELAKHSSDIARRVPGARPDISYFTLTAGSAWALRTSSGGYDRSLLPSRLAGALGVHAGNVRILNGDVRSEWLSGWDGGAGLPMEARAVVLAGSTFLCGVLNIEGATLASCLENLTATGIGSCRVEGLGRVIVNHPLHFPSENPNAQ